MANTLIEIIETAKSSSLVDVDGYDVTLDLFPGLIPAEIQEFESSLPIPLPDDVRELLSYTAGFAGVVADRVDFTGQASAFELAEVFPHGIPIASDGCGNFWVVDLSKTSKGFGPIYFACHDAPVILYQCESLEEFLSELFRDCLPPHDSLISDLCSDRLHNVWRRNPGVIKQREATQHSDPELAGFAQTLEESWSIIDLREAEPGMGFSWARYGPNTLLKRHPELPIFAYCRPKGFFQKLLGW